MSKMEIQNVLQPGKTYRVDGTKYTEMRRVVLAVLPKSAPGLTPAEVIASVKPKLDTTVFPEVDKAGWWVKAVQLDLEAKGLIRRSEKPPVRLWQL